MTSGGIHQVPIPLVVVVVVVVVVGGGGGGGGFPPSVKNLLIPPTWNSFPSPSTLNQPNFYPPLTKG